MAHVHAIDLQRLARAAGCTERELLRGIEVVGYSASGAIVGSTQSVRFTADVLPDGEPAPGIDVALVSLAARPGVLDGTRPKCLMQVGRQPLIGHVLDQLHAGGIRRVIIVLGSRGAMIRKAVMALPVARKISVQFVDLGPSYARGFARSLLAASALLGSLHERFLLCTPDHIFEASLVEELRTGASDPSIDAVALVEDNARSITGEQPATAVHVRLELMGRAGGLPVAGCPAWPEHRVVDIGIGLEGATAIEAGLYQCNGSLFAVLASMSATRSYFTLAEAMASLVSTGRLGAHKTSGRRWIGLETLDQVESTLRTTVGSDGRTRFPWQIRTAHVGFNANSAGGASASMVADVESSLSMAAPHQLVLPIAAERGLGTFVPTPSQTQLDLLMVPASCTPLATAPAAAAVTHASVTHASGLAAPLLPPSVLSASRAAPFCVSVAADAVPSFVAGSFSEDVRALSIDLAALPPPAIAPPAPAAITAGSAYLIELRATELRTSQRHWLALPAPREKRAPLAVLRCGPSPSLALPPLLPPAVTSVRLAVAETAAGEDCDPQVALTVTRRVPLVGWALLASALLACYSGAAATALQQSVLPTQGTTFLRSAWRGTCSALLSGACACAYPVSRADLLRALTLRLPRRTSTLLLLSGLAFFVNFGGYNVALEHTSISHAALFTSCSSIYIVTSKILTAALGWSPQVPTSHLYGVALGGVGALFTMCDTAPTAATAAVRVSVAGDLTALSSGLAAACYLTLAEAMRVEIDALATFTLVLAQFAALSLATAYLLDAAPPSLAHPLDPLCGAVGWLHPSATRLATQLWLGLVVDLAGNFGFIAVMAYVPALTVSAAMLLGPLVASAEGIAVGVDVLPGPWTLGGGLLIMLGSVLISLATSERTATVEISRRG